MQILFYSSLLEREKKKQQKTWGNILLQKHMFCLQTVYA